MQENENSSALILYRSPWKMLTGAAGVLLFTLAGFALLKIGGFSGIVVGWIVIILCPPLSIAVIVTLFNRKPVLVIDEKGITDTRLGGFIPWSNITGISVRRIKMTTGTKLTPMLCINLADEQKLPDSLTGVKSVLAKTGKALGVPPATINPAGLTGNIDEIIFHINIVSGMKVDESER